MSLDTRHWVSGCLRPAEQLLLDLWGKKKIFGPFQVSVFITVSGGVNNNTIITIMTTTNNLWERKSHCAGWIPQPLGRGGSLVSFASAADTPVLPSRRRQNERALWTNNVLGNFNYSLQSLPVQRAAHSPPANVQRFQSRCCPLPLCKRTWHGDVVSAKHVCFARGQRPVKAKGKERLSQYLNVNIL